MSILNEPPDPALSPDGGVLLHVHDLPQLYQKPTAAALLEVLQLLSFAPSSFSGSEDATRVRVIESGIPGYLTSVVSSRLGWIEDESTQESIWSAASARLSERSGRNAMPAMTRSFTIAKDLTIQLHEPTLTEDNLGLKTWTSSLLMSRRLHIARAIIPGEIEQVLELGAGTGLVGISAACVWETHVTLTDLPEIVPNLQKNLDLNSDVVRQHHGKVEARALDWSDGTNAPQSEQVKFKAVLAADPIYSTDHPRMLVDAVRRWIRFESDARFLVELPLRDRYDEERQELRERLLESGFKLVLEGTDVGHDDWQGQDGRPSEVTCWWSIWKPDVAGPAQGDSVQ